jgi:hypothetical protein
MRRYIRNSCRPKDIYGAAMFLMAPLMFLMTAVAILMARLMFVALERAVLMVLMGPIRRSPLNRPQLTLPIAVALAGHFVAGTG